MTVREVEPSDKKSIMAMTNESYALLVVLVTMVVPLVLLAMWIATW